MRLSLCSEAPPLRCPLCCLPSAVYVGRDGQRGERDLVFAAHTQGFAAGDEGL